MNTTAIDPDLVDEIRDKQTYVVLRALRVVLERKTDDRLIEAIVEDVLAQLSAEEGS